MYCDWPPRKENKELFPVGPHYVHMLVDAKQRNATSMDPQVFFFLLLFMDPHTQNKDKEIRVGPMNNNKKKEVEVACA